MSNKTIAWSADWHLKEYLYGSRKIGLDAFYAAREVLSKLADLNVDTLLLAGDTWDTKRLSAHVGLQTQNLHNHAVKCGVSMLNISGNHDLSHPSWTSKYDAAYHELRGIELLHLKRTVSSIAEDALQDEADFKASFTDLNRSRLGFVCADFTWFPRSNDSPSILGIPFVTTDTLRSHLECLKQWTDKPDILMLHVAVKELVGFPAPSALELAELAGAANCAVLLGDIHINKLAELPGGVLTGYPGSISMCNSAEPSDKSFKLLNFTGSLGGWTLTSTQDVDIPQRRKHLEVSVHYEADFEKFITELEQERSEHTPTVKITLNCRIDNFKMRIRTALKDDNAVVHFKENWRRIQRGDLTNRLDSITKEYRNRSILDALPLLVSKETKPQLYRLCEDVLTHLDAPREVIESQITTLLNTTCSSTSSD